MPELTSVAADSLLSSCLISAVNYFVCTFISVTGRSTLGATNGSTQLPET